MKKLALFAILAFMASSCVSSKVYKDLQAKFADLEAENSTLRKGRDGAQAAEEVAQSRIKNLESELATLRQKSSETKQELENLNNRYQDLNRSYEYLLENNNELLASNQAENKKLVAKLNKLQAELSAKEDSLRLENDRLQKLDANLQKLGQEIQVREARISELESAMARKDSTVEMVRQRLRDALRNFDGKGLTVEERDGKVYVSLENRLLFPSASWTVEAEGRKALEELAVVLAENPDLQVMVEGHTDADAFNGRTAVKDNWDLSVMRATSIVKILVANEGVNKANITAAGRSEYVPVASNDTPEGKAKNRRTEIIITPNLSELNQLLEMN
ncbi:OmpA family protein [Croceimicrobium hydrocarbonivorans]|uniref:OmpA family protein n=1 Tax=Croceimicrobium hydrocarbonivorans TaxID=2761580 RepID=A0A7H0VIL6_9FLAO|nr:OmpA family protein [Croceimicrobium hydrocarbonivorans]QNR25564.1 OmpA family protein [Croceimicrobium hydrocarbonivorans]|tara:strand:- start:3160 stop:4158 length:999 start_codon:yes stop_codon:yes gene_type:complete